MTTSDKAPASSTPLFRLEVTGSHSQQWLGAIRLAQPMSAWLIVGVAFIVACSLIAYITLGSITKKARVTGIIVPRGGSISITAPNAGTLVRSLVREGGTVTKGQALFELSTERQGDQGEITALVGQQLLARQQSLGSELRMRVNQINEKKQAINSRLNNLSNEAAQLDQEIGLGQRRQAMAQESLSRYQTLQAGGYVSGAQTQQKQEDLIDLATRLSVLQRNKLQLQANKLALQSEYADLNNSLANDQAQLQRALASLQQEIAENGSRKTSLIIASQAGAITTISYQTGQSVSAGQALATLIPSTSTEPGQAPFDYATQDGATPLEVHLYAPSRTAGFVANGQAVLIRYQAYPYQKFGLQRGTVTDVSKTPFAPNELPPSLASTILSNAQQSVLGFNSNEALYRIKVKLNKQTITTYGQAQALKPGMTLEADVLQDNRKIWEWILEPLLAITHAS
ncbi:MAG: HlyD family efflux transporter periplasmic adaptor subunit [Pseudomonadota bacterium]